MELTIREAALDDSPALTQLSSQLGYPLPETAIRKNLEAILATDSEIIYVAIHDEKVIGWIGVMHSLHLTSGTLYEISGLVIDEQFHGKGAGKQLVAQAEKWALEKGETVLRVRSNMVRKEAHAFYWHLGFKTVKEQMVFERALK